LPWKLHMCTPLNCPGGKNFFIDQMRSFFFSIPHWIDPISWCNISHWLLSLLEVSQCGLFRVHPKKRSSWLYWLINSPLPFLVPIHPREIPCFDCCLVFGVLWWIHVSPTVTKRHKNSSILRLNNAKHSCEISTWMVQSPHNIYLA
jgi:hypothetical protein